MSGLVGYDSSDEEDAPQQVSQPSEALKVCCSSCSRFVQHDNPNYIDTKVHENATLPHMSTNGKSAGIHSILDGWCMGLTGSRV